MMNRATRSCYQIADGINISGRNDENDPISAIDRPYFPLAPAALAPDPCRVRHDGGAGLRTCCHPPRGARALPRPRPPGAGRRELMRVYGRWFPPPRAELGVRPTAPPLPSSAA